MLACAGTCAAADGVAAALAFALQAVGLLRVSAEAEIGGIDIADHGETGYDLTPAAGSGAGAFALAGIGAKETPEAEPKAAVSQKIAG